MLRLHCTSLVLFLIFFVAKAVDDEEIKLVVPEIGVKKEVEVVSIKEFKKLTMTIETSTSETNEDEDEWDASGESTETTELTPSSTPDLIDLNPDEQAGDPLDATPVELENFYAPNVTITHENVTTLNLTVSIPPESVDAQFYTRATRNLRSVAPNLKIVQLDGGYVHYPGAKVSSSFDKEIEFAKTNLFQITRALNQENMTIESIDYTVWIYTQIDSNPDVDYAAVLSTVFDELKVDASSIGSDLHEFAISTRLHVDDARIPLRLVVRVQELSSVAFKRLDAALPVGRSPFHRSPMAPISPVIGFIGAVQESVRLMQRRFNAWLRRYSTGFMHDVGSELRNLSGRIRNRTVERSSVVTIDSRVKPISGSWKFFDPRPTSVPIFPTDEKSPLAIKLPTLDKMLQLTPKLDGLAPDSLLRFVNPKLGKTVDNHSGVDSSIASAKTGATQLLDSATKGMLDVGDFVGDLMKLFVRNKEVQDDRVLTA